MVTKEESRGLESQPCKSCDRCRSRKVRCIMIPGQNSRCTHCAKRNETCHFTQNKRKLRVKHSALSLTCKGSGSHELLVDDSERVISHGNSRSGTPIEGVPAQLGLSPVFMDRMLENHGSTGVLRDNSSLLIAPEHDVTTSSLAFFSERRIRSLSHRLGNDRLSELVETIESVIRTRLLAQGPSSISPITFRTPSDIEHVPLEKAKSYIDSYFQQLHPIYPFLDRLDFENKVFGPDLATHLTTSHAFTALYYTVMALGCQYHEGGAFDPGSGKAWKLFQVALGLISDIIAPKATLINLQALVAMSIFAMSTCCIQIDEVLLTEATRMAQLLGYHRALGIGDSRHRATCYRTFWVVYFMEKQMGFNFQKGSMIPDYDIGCPIPEVPESITGNCNWFLSAIGFSRVLSQAYTSLFSASASIQSTDSLHQAIGNIESRLERWRLSIPAEFRPGRPLGRKEGGTSSSSQLSSLQHSFKMIVLRTNYHYYGLVIALARLKMHICRQDQYSQQEESKRLLMDTARAIVEESKNIEIAAHTPIYILAVLPLAALFILFDFIVHNPTHPETRDNLSLLDVVAGHFSLLDYKSGGFLPASLLTEFAQIARQYVRDFASTSTQEPPPLPPPPQQQLPHQQQAEESLGGVDVALSWSSQTATENITDLNREETSGDGCTDYRPNIMETWEPRDYLHYPVSPEFGMADTSTMGALNFQSLFGFVVPDFQCGDEV